MKLLFVYLFCLPLILSCGPDVNPCQFTISAYNMYLFFDGTDDGWEYDGFRRSDGYTQERYLGRIKDTAAFIARNMDSDVIILSEVESAAVLNDLLEAGLRKKGYQFYGLASDGTVPLSVGFISRIAPESSAIHSAGGERAMLDLSFNTASGTIRIFGIHARSRLADSSEDIRLQQFGHLRALMADADEDIVIAAGDFNADPRYPEKGMAEYPSAGIEGVPMRITGDPGLASDTVFYSPFLDSEETAAAGTYSYQGTWYFFDNIIVDWRALDGRGLEYSSSTVVMPFEAKDILGRPLAYDSSTGMGYSDHFAVSAKFSSF